MLNPNSPLEPVTLSGRRVRLEPLASRHLPALADAIRDGELWKLPVTLVPHPDDLGSFLRHADEQFAAGQQLAFATIDAGTDTVVGSTRFMKIDRTHRRLEIGFTFIAASWQRSHVNTEAKFLMLRQAFEVLGLHPRRASHGQCSTLARVPPSSGWARRTRACCAIT